jgi:isopenicillin-N epimerase
MQKSDDDEARSSSNKFGHALRSKWLFKDNFTQLNHGAYGATPHAVLAAQWGYMQQMETNMERWMNTDSPGIVDGSSAGLINRSRYALADYVNAPPEDVVLVDNASGAINALLRSLPLKAGDVIIDFAVVYQPFAEFYGWLEATEGITVITVPMVWPLNSTKQVVDAFRNTLASTQQQGSGSGRHVAYAVVSHISSYPCILMPVAELAAVAHAHGVPIIVDGAHALGNIPVDIAAMNGVDFWFGNGHKWLLSPKSSALLYVRKDHQQWLCPYRNDTSCHLRSTVVDTWGAGESFVQSFVWAGTRDRSAFACMWDALEFRQSIGGDSAIMAYNAELAKWGAHHLSTVWNTTNFLSDEFFTSMSDVVLPSTNSTALELVFATLDSDYGISPSGRGSCANPNAAPGLLPGQAGCHFFRLSAQVYLEKSDIVRFGELVLRLLRDHDPSFAG